MESARRENRELENKSANPPKLELSIIGPPPPYGRSVRTVRTDRPYGWSVRTVRTDGPYGRSVRTVRTDGPYGPSVRTVRTDRPYGRSVRTVRKDSPYGRNSTKFDGIRQKQKSNLHQGGPRTQSHNTCHESVERKGGGFRFFGLVMIPNNRTRSGRGPQSIFDL